MTTSDIFAEYLNDMGAALLRISEAADAASAAQARAEYRGAVERAQAFAEQTGAAKNG